MSTNTCPKCEGVYHGQDEVLPDGSLRHVEGDPKDGLCLCPWCGAILVMEGGHLREVTPERLDQLGQMAPALLRTLKAISYLIAIHNERDPNKNLREELLKEIEE